MTKIKRHIIIFTVGAFIFSCGTSYRNKNELLTTANILSVRPGMTMQQVKDILGQPLNEYRSEGYTFYCDCNLEHICKDSCSYTFVYTKPKTRYPYPMVWIHFNSRKKLKEVYVKKYTFLDDRAIYGVESNPCDTLDPIVPLDSSDIYTTNNGLSEFFK